MPPNDSYPDGLIYTGSNDSMIRAFVPHKASPDHILQGHSANVACLFVSKNQTLLSTSWDTTAKVWLNQKTVMTLKDHEGAVWCGVILSEVGLMVIITLYISKLCTLRFRYSYVFKGDWCSRWNVKSLESRIV